MKKQLTVALGLAVLATPAFASKARLEALGEDNFGSYYINDNRNIFLNPAHIVNHKDLVNFEFGRSGAGTAASTTADAVNNPKAEGGFVKGHGNFAYGFQFGNTTASSNTLRAVGAANLQERNPLDFFIGGDAGLKWGANVTWEESDIGGTTERLSSQGLRTRLGVIAGNVDAFAQISLKNRANDFQGNTFEGNVGYLIGASTQLNDYRVFADYRTAEGDFRRAGILQDSNIRSNTGRVGVGRVEKLNDRANLFAKVMVQRVKTSTDFASTAPAATIATEETSTVYTAPINMGLEYDAVSWLQLRASVVHNIWSSNNTKVINEKRTVVQSPATGVRAGASLKFGEFTVDGLVSTDSNGDLTTIESTDASTAGGKGGLRTDNLLTRASVTYRF